MLPSIKCPPCRHLSHSLSCGSGPIGSLRACVQSSIRDGGTSSKWSSCTSSPWVRLPQVEPVSTFGSHWCVLASFHLAWSRHLFWLPPEPSLGALLVLQPA